MIRTTLQMVAGAALVFGAFWNLHAVDVAVSALPSRAQDDVTVIENRYLPVEFALIKEQPSPKRIGYMSALTLSGKPMDENAGLRWSQLRYLMIPRILLADANETYVIGDFKKDEPVPAVPENLVPIYDSGDGLILYKQKQIR